MYGYSQLFDEVGERIYSPVEIEYMEEENRKALAWIDGAERELEDLIERWREIAGPYYTSDDWTCEEYIDGMPEEIREACREIERQVDELELKIDLAREEMF